MWEMEGVYFPEGFCSKLGPLVWLLLQPGPREKGQGWNKGWGGVKLEYLSSGSTSQEPFWAVTLTPLLGPLQTPLLNSVSQPGYKSFPSH